MLNKMNAAKILLGIFISVSFCFTIPKLQNNFNEGDKIPKDGYVPNKETAEKIAEAVWLPIFGNKIYDCKPFIAKLSEDKNVWIVEGTFYSEPPHREGNTIFHRKKGGVPYVEISKKDCKILRLYFSK